MNIKQMQLWLTAWAQRCFGDDQVNDPRVRAMRVLEEAIELAQACGVAASKSHQLVTHVYYREPGDPVQELGGVGVTWLVAASSLGISALAALRKEVDRVRSKPEKHFTARNQAKVEAGFGVSA